MQARIREILERRKNGWLPSAFRAFMYPLGLCYGVIGLLRRKLYNSNWFLRHRCPIPVVSIGNLTAGGTGKTPFVIMICRLLKAMGRNPAILLRGYKSSDPGNSDECLLYKKLCPEFGVFAGSDRVVSSFKAISDGYDVMVLDDGFQHIRLMRDMDIVLVDASCPFGGGMPLPAGLLREFKSALSWADMICLTRTDQVSGGTVQLVTERVSEVCPNVPVLSSVHRPVKLANLDGHEVGLDLLVGERVVALSGIGRPDSFASTLRDLGAEICESLDFADHANYTAAMITTKLRRLNSSMKIIITEKDAVKLETVIPQDMKDNIFVLGVEMRISNMPLLREKLAQALADAPRL